MKGISSAVCAAFVLATGIAVLAQSQTSPQTSSAQSSAKSVTVTGCVQRAEEGGATGTTGTTGATVTKFILAKASIKPDQTAGTTGSTAAPPSTAIASEYKLDTDESKLSAHVGHKVEVTGEIEQPSMSEQKPPASAANAPTLKVDSVKMVAATCQ